MKFLTIILSITMKFLILFTLTGLVVAQSSTSSGTPMAATASASTAEYSITALPAVIGQPSCVFNCLIPIGLADPSGCDDVTNECACLSAPSDVLDVLTGCVETVCMSSTSAYAAVATSLYQSYCQSVFGTAQFSQAFVSESAAAAASASSSMGGSSTASATATPSASGTSDSVVWTSSSSL